MKMITGGCGFSKQLFLIDLRQSQHNSHLGTLQNALHIWSLIKYIARARHVLIRILATCLTGLGDFNKLCAFGVPCDNAHSLWTV